MGDELNLRRALAGKALVGTFQCLRDPHVPALLARAGFEVVVVDTEHFYMNPETVQNIVQGARAAGIYSIIRPPEISRAAIQRALDSGPDGILVPLVSGQSDARRVVDFARYSPLGARGFHGLTPATEWGARSSKDQVATDRARTLVAVQIETPSGVAAAEAIAEVDGIDMLFVGPGDLSQSMGLMSAYEDPALIGAVTHVLEAARLRGLLSGIYAARENLETLARLHDARLVLRGSDTRCLLDGATAVRQP